MLGPKFLLVGATVASATALGIVGVSALSQREQDTKTDKNNTPEDKKSSCRVFQVTDKSSSPKFSSIDWRNEKAKDQKASTTNKQFWEDVENACQGTGGKKSINGKVYVTKTGDKWNYSSADQKVWGNDPQ
ncbi:hypothetical protein MHC_02080 [Mycoplasma haemocanis str. Illinois]|uniref:Lipoprotein n=1 Tax=Mycoplasma haemocanis (strain Illinois) TaxID=1111676 RepID=H6N6L0_MYCHN|nr:hypothetical protein MHC_02080 [Mycoplasma haemocanis str. Illinois]